MFTVTIVDINFTSSLAVWFSTKLDDIAPAVEIYTSHYWHDAKMLTMFVFIFIYNVSEYFPNCFPTNSLKLKLKKCIAGYLAWEWKI